MLFTELFKFLVSQLAEFVLKVAVAFAEKYSTAAEAKRINCAFALLIIRAPAVLHRFNFLIFDFLL